MAAADFDAIVIGGGPGGATAGLLLARAGLRTLVAERATFPRFHIGESLLPRNFPLIRELGLEEALGKLPHVPKLGVEFMLGDDSAAASFGFDQGLLPGSQTANVERAAFDAMLLDAARDAGADVRQGATVKRIVRLRDDDVAVEVDGREISARWLIDASGQGTVVARHLGIRHAYSDRYLRKVAYFAHFENVQRRAGREAGYPCIAICEEGWFWLIPLDERRTSIGLVLDAEVARQVDVPANRMLAWGIERCPAVRKRMCDASGPDTNLVAADFSYNCRPYAGPGYFLVGDAAAFMDPIFSTGVCLAMISGQEAAKHVIQLVKGRTGGGFAELSRAAPVPRRARSDASRTRKQYIAYLDGSMEVFWRLIRGYYDHSFRELLVNGRGPLRVHQAILSLLAGHVFPRPPMCLRWRLRLFEFYVWLNRRLPLVPRRGKSSLLVPNGPANTEKA